jgi:ribulose 1,5-bisphosphate synthetase/thiazole synthase
MDNVSTVNATRAHTEPGVAVSLTASQSTATIHVDPTRDDAIVVIAVTGPDGHQVDIVGVDLTAGTVGIWTGSDPDNQVWTVVQHLNPRPAGTA